MINRRLKLLKALNSLRLTMATDFIKLNSAINCL
jgi:hypothetical protein